MRVTPDLHALAAISLDNHGIITRADLNAASITSMQLSRLVAKGILRRVGPRVVAFAGSPSTFEFELTAALANAGDTAVASHRAAARLHRLEGFEYAAAEVTVSVRKRNSSGGKIVVHSTTFLPLADRTVVDGFACTTAARTIIDLTEGGASQRELENAIDSAVRNGQVSVDHLRRRIRSRRHRGLRGVRLLDSLLVDSGGTNRLERRFLALCRTGGLPRPKCQVVHRRGTQTVARVDFHFAPLPLVAEVEGQIGHASPRQRQRDATRRRDLADAGRDVVSFTFEDVFQRPDETVAAVKRAIARLTHRN